MVAVAGSPGSPVVLARRRIELADTAIPGSRQPYHAAERLDVDRAETLIRQCRDSSTRLAMRAVSATVARLEQNGLTVVGAGILFASGRPLPDLAATLRSHALIHTAEGEFFREVLVRASEQCSLRVTKVKEREVWDRGTTLRRWPPICSNRLADPTIAGPPGARTKAGTLAAWTNRGVDVL